MHSLLNDMIADLSRNPLWAAAVGAIVAALVVHALHMRRTRPYDAWWYFNLRPSTAKLAERPWPSDKQRRARRERSSSHPQDPGAGAVEPTP